MSVESARRVLTVASTMAEEGRRLLDLALEMRALALAELPAGTVLTFSVGRLPAYKVTLQPDGTWTLDDRPMPPWWVTDQWQARNLHLPTVDGS